MASSYPGGIDAFSTSHATSDTIQAATDNDHADAINKIEAELGTNPSGSAATVQAAITALREVTINTQSGTSYTLVLADAGALVRCTSGSAVTVTVPLNATVAYPVGTSIEIRQAGAGQVTVSPTGGVTLNSESAMRKTAAQHRSVSLVKVATDTWDLDGSLAA
jgi:hypothetical protein